MSLLKNKCEVSGTQKMSESDRYSRDGRVWDICSTIDAENFRIQNPNRFFHYC